MPKFPVLRIAFACLLLSGCTTAPKTPAPASAQPGPAHPAGEYTVRIESEPAGGLVVVDGVPAGKAPVNITVPASVHGFCRRQISLKLRFVATDPGQQSQTVEEVLTPLDKVPAAIHFTPAGATRTAR